MRNSKCFMRLFILVFLNRCLTVCLFLAMTILSCSCINGRRQTVIDGGVTPFIKMVNVEDSTTAGLLSIVCEYYQHPDSLSYYEGNEYITCHIDWNDSLSILKIRRYLGKEGVYDSGDSDEQCLFRMRFLGFEVSPLCVFRKDSLSSVIQALHDKTPVFMRCKGNKWLVDGYDEGRQLFHCIGHTGKDSLLSVSSLLEYTESFDGETYYTVIEKGVKNKE